MSAKPNEFPILGDLYCAVFNCSTHDKRKGREAVITKFGGKGWQKVKDRMRTGIMEIFQHKPTPETNLYALTVGRSAEGRAAKRKQREQQQT
jgi:hypothetical protein